MAQEWKKQKVSELKEELANFPVVGIVDMKGLPNKQLQRIKKEVGNKLILKMTKKSILLRALEGSIQEKLKEHLGVMPAIFFTRENPFKLFKILKKSMVPAFAKAGDILPSDVKVSDGPTDFMPGPIISEFSKFKIKTKVEGGKIAILQETTVAHEGDTVTGELASFMQKMGIKPMKIGLNLECVQEEGVIYDKNVLDIDEQEYLDRIALASRHALNLSVEAGIATKDNIELLIITASRHARNLAMDSDVLTKDLIGEQLSKAERQALGLKNEIGV